MDDPILKKNSFIKLEDSFKEICMPNFYIEMGQGIVAQGDFSVTTSTLHSCTFIGGYSSKTGKAGAFHCPGGGWKTSFNEIVRWQANLEPTIIILVTGLSGKLEDDTQAEAWFEDDDCTVELKKENGAAMRSNPFRVLLPLEMRAFDFGGSIDLSHSMAKQYIHGNDFKYDVYGKNEFK